ncbi:MAG: YggT family protein [Pseudomonadota bacterium]
MFVLGYFLQGVAHVIDMALTVYMYILIARAVISWVNPDPYNPIVRFLYSVTEPVLYRIRRILPISFGGIDFSPMILILIIIFLQHFLVPTMVRIAVQFN